jgi:hypothetical protein
LRPAPKWLWRMRSSPVFPDWKSEQMEKTSQVYERLYHYTTWDGLLGILRTKVLWATHYKFLKDYSEIVLFREELLPFILPHVREQYERLAEQSPQLAQEIKQKGGLDRFIQCDTQVLVDAMYKATGDEIYIVSFCGQHEDPYVNNNGLLSQWRAYGVGGGFALVFSAQGLEEMMEKEVERYAYNAMYLADVVYSGDESKLKDELSEDLSAVADQVTHLIERLLSRGEPSRIEGPHIGGGYGAFVRCISRYKHRAFAEEKEVRLVALPTVRNQAILRLAGAQGIALRPEKEKKSRNRNGQSVPYIELFDSVGTQLPIERIIVGPQKERAARAAALREMLDSTKIEITCSDVPLV